MVELLLQYLRAERDRLCDLHLSTAAAMLPYFLVYDHVNYTRWVSVYVADKRLLPTTPPEVHAEFTPGNFGVQHTERQINQIWTDMVLKHTVNCHVKSRVE